MFFAVMFLAFCSESRKINIKFLKFLLQCSKCFYKVKLYASTFGKKTLTILKPLLLVATCVPPPPHHCLTAPCKAKHVCKTGLELAPILFPLLAKISKASTYQKFKRKTEREESLLANLYVRGLGVELIY
jgi:hypothetical protein